MESESLPTVMSGPVADSRPTTAVALADMEPAAMVATATKMANVLADVIERQKLYEVIQNKKHVKIEGWLTLGTMLGVTAREVSCDEMPDGSYVAKVDLVSVRTGRVIGSASSLCGADERRWKSADRYARRSMAVTRATGKAFRINFSWIMALAGFDPTPEAEMPRDEPPAPAVKPGFDPDDAKQAAALAKMLEKRGVPAEKWEEIGALMRGKTSKDLDDILGTAGVFEQ